VLGTDLPIYLAVDHANRTYLEPLIKAFPKVRLSTVRVSSGPHDRKSSERLSCAPACMPFCRAATVLQLALCQAVMEQ